MDLVAATLSVKISVMLRKEFQPPITIKIFCTDSEAALGYIRNHPESSKCLLQIELKSSKKILVTPSGFM